MGNGASYKPFHAEIQPCRKLFGRTRPKSGQCEPFVIDLARPPAARSLVWFRARADA
jgi:hypothetical protein